MVNTITLQRLVKNLPNVDFYYLPSWCPELSANMSTTSPALIPTSIPNVKGSDPSGATSPVRKVGDSNGLIVDFINSEGGSVTDQSNKTMEISNSTEDLANSHTPPHSPVKLDKPQDKEKGDVSSGRRSLPSRKARAEAASKLASSLSSNASKDHEDSHSVDNEKKAVKRSLTDGGPENELSGKRAVTCDDISLEEVPKPTETSKDVNSCFVRQVEVSKDLCLKGNKSPLKKSDSEPPNISEDLPESVKSSESSMSRPLKGLPGSSFSVSKSKPGSEDTRPDISTRSTASGNTNSEVSNPKGKTKFERSSSDSSGCSESLAVKLSRFGPVETMKKTSHLKSLRSSLKEQVKGRSVKVDLRAIGTQTENDDFSVKPIILKLLDSDEKLKIISGFPSFQALDHVTDATLKMVTNNPAMISDLGPCLREWIIITCLKFSLNLDFQTLAVLFQLGAQECEQIVQKTSRFLRKSLVLPSCQSFVCDMPLSVLNGIADCTDKQEDSCPR